MIIHTKYDIGDEVWFMLANKCEKVVVVGILITKGEVKKSERYTSQEIRYNLHKVGYQDYQGWSESSLFLSKEELLKSL